VRAAVGKNEGRRGPAAGRMQHSRAKGQELKLVRKDQVQIETELEQEK